MGPVLKRVVLAAVPCVLLLSGCGVAGTDFNPGVAARVGDDVVSTEEVDDLTNGYCGAVEQLVQDGGQLLPLAAFKTGIVAQLALKTAAEQIAADYDVTPSADYKTSLNAIKDQAETVPASHRADYIEVLSTQPYYIDLLTQVGAIKLAEEGEQDPTIDFQQARGQDEFAAWAEREGLEFDPRYGITLVDGAPSPTDTDITYAATDIAKAGVEAAFTQEPDAAYAASLPAAAVCG